MKRTILVFGIMLLGACTAATQPEAKQSEAEEVQNVQQTQVKLDIKHVDADGVAEHMAGQSNAIILDIRTPAEFNAGHIEGAVNIDFKADDFKTKIAELDRSAPYLVHCRSGGRSTRSLSVFEDLGFTDVTHLDGGINGWKAAGLSLTDPCRTC